MHWSVFFVGHSQGARPRAPTLVEPLRLNPSSLHSNRSCSLGLRGNCRDAIVVDTGVQEVQGNVEDAEAEGDHASDEAVELAERDDTETDKHEEAATADEHIEELEVLLDHVGILVPLATLHAEVEDGQAEKNMKMPPTQLFQVSGGHGL